MKKYRLEKDGFVIPTWLNKIEINGWMFYLDVCWIDPTSEELNLENIEKLIYVSGQELSEKQKFFISIISLESYFEYIIYVMLVVSRNISKSKYDDLSTACSRSKEAFENNTAFFQTEISVHPWLNIPVKNIEDGEKERILWIFDKIRKLRNDIIHAWSFKDKTFEEIKESLIALGELNIVSNDTDIILRDARNLLVKWYAEIETILRTRIRALEMRRLVNEELESRGFSWTK